MAGKVSSKLYIRRMILAHSMGKRILKRRCIDIIDVHERQVTHPGRGWGGGEVMKREISREVIYRQLTAKVSGLKLCPSPWDQCLL